MGWQTWIEPCAAVLRGNQIESHGYRYTRPAPHVYEYQWLWDSCFHAISYRWFDIAMAQDELLSLCAGQITEGADAGMIPHMIYWNDEGTALWGQPRQSIITQPPLVAVAAKLIYESQPDEAFLRKIWPAQVAFHDWMDRRRDPDGDGLVTLIHPWEAGCDASQRWDGPLGLQNPTPDETKATRHGLVAKLIEADCDPMTLAERGLFHVEAVDFNAVRVADLEATAWMAEILGEDATVWHERAERVRTAIQQKFIFEDGVFDLNGMDETPVKVESFAPFYLLFGGCVDQVMAEKLVSQLTDPARFWPRYPIPTTPINDPLYSPGDYWRGNVWPSVNWLIYQGLRRYGFNDIARELTEKNRDLVAASGFYEYYDPQTGKGHGASQQSWATVILDMLATEDLE